LEATLPVRGFGFCAAHQPQRVHQNGSITTNPELPQFQLGFLAFSSSPAADFRQVVQVTLVLTATAIPVGQYHQARVLRASAST
jgi:hypothetical protein